MSNLGPQFKNVYDFSASKQIKESTGQGRAVRKTTPESPEETKRYNEALELNKPQKPQRGKVAKTLSYLGLIE